MHWKDKAKCTSIFIEQPEWVSDLDHNEFKFLCPKCSAKLGDVKLSGQKCSCKEWVSPAFQVNVQKVDEEKKIGPLNQVPAKQV